MSKELQAGYEFTKAQLARLELLEKQNSEKDERIVKYIEDKVEMRSDLEVQDELIKKQGLQIILLEERLEVAEQNAARYETLQNMSGLCFNYAAEYQLIGRLNDYVDAIKPQVDKAIAAMKESK